LKKEKEIEMSDGKSNHKIEIMYVHNKMNNKMDNFSENSDDTLIETESMESTQSGYSTDYDIMDDISIFDYLFSNIEKENNKYYIGSCINALQNEQYIILFGACVSPRCFYNFYFSDIKKYVHICKTPNTRIFPFEIMKLNIVDDEYRAVIKTYWIRLIQRHWKKTFTEKKRILNQRKKLISLIHFEYYGKWKTRSIPSIKGMLSVYALI
jgi:hypothetical protein